MNLILKNLVCREEPKFLKSEINYKGLDHYFLINIMSKIFSPWHTVLKAVKGLFNVSDCFFKYLYLKVENQRKKTKKMVAQMAPKNCINLTQFCTV